jgi:hypothetical protein
MKATEREKAGKEASARRESCKIRKRAAFSFPLPFPLLTSTLFNSPLQLSTMPRAKAKELLREGVKIDGEKG